MKLQKKSTLRKTILRIYLIELSQEYDAIYLIPSFFCGYSFKNDHQNSVLSVSDKLAVSWTNIYCWSSESTGFNLIIIIINVNLCLPKNFITEFKFHLKNEESVSWKSRKIRIKHDFWYTLFGIHKNQILNFKENYFDEKCFSLKILKFFKSLCFNFVPKIDLIYISINVSDK